MKNKINILEYSITFFIISIAPFLGIGIFNLLKVAKTDSIISILLSIIIGLLILLIFIRINNYKPNLSLKEKIIDLFDKKIATILIIVISISFFILSLIISYNINSFIISQFLSETPILFIAIITDILVIYLSSKKINIITRVSGILGILSILLILVATISGYKCINLDNINPLFSNEFMNTIKGTFNIILFNTIYIFLFLIIPKQMVKNSQNINKYITISLIFGFVTFLVITVYTISTLGIDLSLLYHYPAYIVMKKITIFGFIDKIENFIIVHWIFEMFILLNMIIYFLSKMTNIKPYILVISKTLIYTIFFYNSTFYNYIVSKYLPLISIIIIICILLIYIKIKTPKRFKK